MAYIGPDSNSRQRAMDLGLQNILSGLDEYAKADERQKALDREEARQKKADQIQQLTLANQLGVSPAEMQGAMTLESGLENLSRTLEENKAKAQTKAAEEQKYKRNIEAQKLQIEKDKALSQADKDKFTRGLELQKLGLMKEKAAGKPEGEKEFKPTQYLAATFAQRALDAEKAFKDLEAKGFDRTGMGTSLAASWAPEALKSEDLKQQQQAERSFANAILRKESGAAISPDEFQSAEVQYFPRVGDTPAVLEQKRRNREVAYGGLSAEAGGALGQLKTQVENYPVANAMAVQPQKTIQNHGRGIIPTAMADGVKPVIKRYKGQMYSVDANGDMTPIQGQ